MTEIDLSKVKAGDYELIVLSWDEITSKPGQPFDYVTHRKGDTVTLDVEQARRLLAGGAVKPKGKATKADTPPPPPAADKPESDKADDILTFVGEDQARAAEYLVLEQAKPTGQRSTLIEKLEAIVTEPS